MMLRRLRSGAVLLLIAGLVAAGCGLKPEAMDYYLERGGVPGAGDGGVAADGTGEGLVADPETGELIESGEGAAADGVTAGGLPGSPGGTGGTAGTGGTGGLGSGQSPRTAGGPGTTPAGPGDTTGVTDTTIKIGVHAPVTGAAAIPQESFRNAVGVYSHFINRKGGIHGRKLIVEFEDDKFSPNHARQVCKDLAEQEKVFLLIGGAGSDQIDACARYAASVGVPYLSGGVHETRPGLGSIATRTYFALSLTYEQQLPLLVDLIRADHKGKEVGLLVASNDSLDNFYARTDSALKKSFAVALSKRIPKKVDNHQAPGVARDICDSGAGVVVWLAAPASLIAVAKSMDPVCADRVTIIGPGLTNGLNIVTAAGCNELNGAQFYSPFPALNGPNGIDAMDPDYKDAYRQKNNAEPDDIGIALWGLEKLVAQLLRATGKDLTREKFMATLSSGKTFTSGVFPPARFSGGSRFGGTGMHLLKADCGDRQYKTQKVNDRP